MCASSVLHTMLQFGSKMDDPDLTFMQLSKFDLTNEAFYCNVECLSEVFY